ncbi:MAG TPA: flavin reductase family protein [Candidatus Cloacimonadota bacterium]|nr:flavin reductase family protein [Candidatus Cloacimonadota bacterium]
MKLCLFTEVNNKIHKPMKAALVVSRKPDGSHNLITVEWFMRTSIEPAQYAISIGHSRYSYACLTDFPYFNIVFPSSDNKTLLSLAGSQSGRDIDKFTAGNVQSNPGRLQKLPIITDAAACYECEIVTQLRSGDHTIFVGEVKYSWINPEKELFVYRS